MKRICALLLSVCLTLTLFGIISGNAQALAFSDVKSDHWAYAYITYLSEKNVLSGDGNGIFRPDDSVKRCEFIKMINTTFGITGTTTVNYTNMSEWAIPYIKAAAAQGYLMNYKPDANFDAKLTREEAVALLIRYLGFEASADADTSKITDYAKITDYYKAYVLAAIENGIINGYPDGTFKPANILTRSEALTILYRAAGAIYSVSSGVPETGCNSENAVINANASLIGLTFKGNVYVTEGAALTAFNNCTIDGTLYIRGKSTVSLFNTKADRIIILGESSVSLSSGCSVTRMEAKAQTGLSINENCAVTTFIAYNGAENSAISGKGSLTNFGVYVNGVSTVVTPQEYFIAKNCTALIDGRKYTEGSGKPASTGFGFAEVRSFDGDTNTLSLRFSSQADGKVYAAVWLRSDPAPDAAALAAKATAYTDVVAGKDTELRIALPCYGFEYNAALVYVSADGAAVPVYNNGLISSSAYTDMTTEVPVPQTASAPTWSMSFNKGAIVLSFNQAVYIRHDNSTFSMLSSLADFMNLYKTDSEGKRLLPSNEYVMDISTGNGRCAISIYLRKGIEAGCEYNVVFTKELCNIHGLAVSPTSLSLLSRTSDVVAVTPTITPDKSYVSNGGSINIHLPESAAGLRYSYAINGGSASLVSTIYGDVGISIDGLGSNAVMDISAEAISSNGSVVGNRVSKKFIVNVAPIITLYGKEYVGKDQRADFYGNAPAAVSLPSSLAGTNFRTELYFNDILQPDNNPRIVGTGVLRAVLYDGTEKIGETVVNLSFPIIRN